MKSTIFCSFDHMDLADLALGRLRSEINGIYEISYLSDYSRDARMDASYGQLRGTAGFFTDHNPFEGYHNAVGVTPSRPVTVKITCDSDVRPRVMSKLVNLHAYRIVAS